MTRTGSVVPQRLCHLYPKVKLVFSTAEITFKHIYQVGVSITVGNLYHIKPNKLATQILSHVPVVSSQTRVNCLRQEGTTVDAFMTVGTTVRREF